VLVGEVSLQFLREVAVVLRELLRQQGLGHRERRCHVRLSGDVGNGPQVRLDVWAGPMSRWVCVCRPCLARGSHRGGKQIGQTDAHVRHGRHDRCAQLGGQGAHIDEPSLGTRLVHAIERKHHRLAQVHQFQSEFEVALKRRGIQHHQKQVGGCERARGQMRLVPGNGRPAVPPQQVLQRHARAFVQIVQAIDGRQRDQ